MRLAGRPWWAEAMTGRWRVKDAQREKQERELRSAKVCRSTHQIEASSCDCYFLSFNFLTLAHLASAAFRAPAVRSSGVSLAALVLPPLEPPIFPRAIA